MTQLPTDIQNDFVAQTTLALQCSLAEIATLFFTEQYYILSVTADLSISAKHTLLSLLEKKYAETTATTSTTTGDEAAAAPNLFIVALLVLQVSMFSSSAVDEERKNQIQNFHSLYADCSEDQCTKVCQSFLGILSDQTVDVFYDLLFSDVSEVFRERFIPLLAHDQKAAQCLLGCNAFHLEQYEEAEPFFVTAKLPRGYLKLAEYYGLHRDAIYNDPANSTQAFNYLGQACFQRKAINAFLKMP